MRFTVVGDTTLDVTVIHDAEPMAGRDRPARIRAGPGGQGANVAVRLARRGAAVRLVSGMADDGAGMVIRAALAADGVDVVNLEVQRTGIVVSLVDRLGERAMLSERVSFSAHELRTPQVTAAVAEADWVHVSGYPLADPGSGDALADLVASRASSARCSIGGGSFVLGSSIGNRLRRARPDLLVFDRGEGLAALNGGAAAAPGTMAGLAIALHQRYDAVAVITDGANPVSAATGEEEVVVFSDLLGGPVLAADATGAGDGLAAAVIASLAGGPWPPSRNRLKRAVSAGVQLGGEVAAVIGAQARVPSEGPA